MVESLTTEAIEAIKSNLNKAENIAKEIKALASAHESVKLEERAIIEKSVSVLIEQLKVIDEPIAALIQSLVPEEIKIKIKRKKKKEKPEIKKYKRISTATGPVYISSESKKLFLEDLGIKSKKIREIRKKILRKQKRKSEELKKPSFISHISNKLFYNFSLKLAKGPLFKGIEKDLRKANMPYMLSSYISIILFVTSIVFVVSIILALALSASLIEAVRNIGIAIALTAVSFFLVISWPANIASSYKKKIDAELPFAVSHMAAIASSKVEPSRIFSILALSKEYKAVGAEIKKIVNQINVYGYDLTTALKNVSKATPSKKLAELFSGMSTTITTGGNLVTYLNEKAKSILMDYKLSRERYSTVIGLYSDIYTALLIAAPLIFMLLLAVISIMGSNFMGMPASTLSNVGIIAIAILNIIFLVFLHLTQPEI